MSSLYGDHVNRFVSSVYKQLEAYSDNSDEINKIIIDFARDGGTGGWNFDRLQNGRYTVVAVCDQDCGDIDLCAKGDSVEETDYDMYEEEDCDKDGTALAIVRTEVSNGNIEADIKMYNCENNICYYGIGLYREHP